MIGSVEVASDAEWHHRMRIERKSAGVCTGCGKIPSVAERTYCVECLARLRRRARERTAKRKSLGQCVTCGLPSAEGIVHCRRCRPITDKALAMRLAAQQRREAIKEKKSRAILLALKHMERLTTRQRQIIALRIGLDRDGGRSGVEVAAILGVSRQAVSAVEKAAWRRIQQAEATIPGQLFPARDEARVTVTQAA